MTERLLRVGEVAEKIGVHRDTVQMWCREGHLTCVRLPSWGKKPGQFRVAMSEVVRYMEKRVAKDSAA